MREFGLRFTGATYVSVFLDTGGVDGGGGGGREEEEEEEEERYGWKGTIKIFARARAYRGFGQARFFSFFLFFLLPRARSLIIQSVLLHLADESIKEERKRERKKCLIFAFEFINESLRHPRNDFERRFIGSPHFLDQFYWKLCL